MINQELGLNWGLRFTNKDFDNKWLSADAYIALVNLLDDYPNCKDKIVTFVGNIIKGNIIFNEMVDVLYDDNKLTTRCLRLNVLELDTEFSVQSEIDIALIDNISAEYMTKSSLETLLNLQDYLEPKCKLIIYNISEWSKQFPKTFKDLLNLSINIKVQE